jgi:hypothetical protein
MSDTPDTTTIGTLRIVGGARDRLATQLDMQRGLTGSRVAPAGLPATAILCIRRVRATIPRQREQGELACAALRSALDDLARGAARPARGAVPPQAEAVVFADRAEMLACLAYDWRAGRAAERWWWRGLLRATPIDTAVIRAWLDAPEYAPAALDHLAAIGEAARFVRALQAGAAHALLRALLERFGLHALRPLLGAAARPDSAEPIDGLPPGAPWRRWAPESSASALGLDQAALLGVGLMLQRAPASLRAPAFAEAVGEWLRAGGSMPEPAAPDKSLELRARVPESTQSPGEGNAPAASPSPTWAPELTPLAADMSAEASALTSVDADALTPSLEHAVAEESAAISPAQPAITLPPVDSGAAAWEASAPPAERPLAAALVDTAFGGLFYLLNLALGLELYGDFTMPAMPGIDLSVWDFLALAGLDLVGQPLQADPIWQLLARLAERPPEQAPGREFMPPQEWRMPPGWLAPFAPGEPPWSADQGRLRVAHPAGFLLLNLAVTGDPRQLSSELRVYDLPPARAADELPPSAEPATPLERWLSWLLPYIRARLRRALGQHNDIALGELVCAHRASVYVSTARLDIVLSLAELPIAIRLAGLDRDPGWIPAVGRSVAFHFE